jgi:hypothetical protein
MWKGGYLLHNNHSVKHFIVEDLRFKKAEERWDRIRREIHTATVTAALAAMGETSAIKGKQSSTTKDATRNTFSTLFKAQTGVGIDEICRNEMATKFDKDDDDHHKVQSIRYHTYLNSEGKPTLRHFRSLPNLHFQEHAHSVLLATEEHRTKTAKIVAPSKRYEREFNTDVLGESDSLRTSSKIDSNKILWAGKLLPDGQYEHQIFVKRRIDRRLSFPTHDNDLSDWKKLLADKCVI